MCGILGCLPAIHPTPFNGALNLLQHRGPDGQGIWTDDRKRITLGHRRLSIIDLSPDGSQPMQYGKYVITYNGEIYNFPELKQELQLLGHKFTTHTDTEVLLAAFTQWQNQCWQRLNGMWALAIWNSETAALTLCRDRFGKKPLYYCLLSDGRFAFASEMKALMPFLPQVSLADDFEWMTQNMFAYEPTEKCLIKGICRFPAGHWGVYKNGSLTTQNYWNTLEHLHPVPARFEEQTEAFAALFTDACKIRMRADVAVGTALSGGLDSSAVICAMAHAARTQPEPQFANRWQHAFVAAMPGTPLDETPYAKAVTDFLKIPATFVNIDANEGLKNLPEYLYLCEDLYITSPVPMIQTYHAAKKNGVSVCIDGHGADELFSGYDTFMFHAFLDCGFNPRQIQNLLQTYRNLSPPNEPQFAKPPVSFANYVQWITGSRNFFKLLPYLPAELIKAFSKPKPVFRKNQTNIHTPDDLGALNKALYQLFHTQNLPTLLRNYDRYSMASGVEIRMPFLDHRIVSYCFSVPYTSKFRQGYTKSLLRHAIAPLMPPQIAWRKYKMGFQTPIANWMQGEWKPFFTGIINEPEFARCPFMNPHAVKQSIEAVMHNPKATYRQAEIAYSAINPYLWHKFVYNRFCQISKIQW
ncbi:asparagine synthase (glutamine-hydrolyzing) [Sphingobacteriales bacterium UPWRP_1]|nr:asparagine synthase (glutamine-hydrolyzing) [Sphingobacteriales bacterium TSM_CSM]PSJ73400.1 asparagine synthase (glutamine-hydrolyzing) [Sphingobacteriales bacterium UPWRP_1]